MFLPFLFGKNHHLVGLEAPVTLAKSLNFTDSQREEILEERERSDRNEKGMNSRLDVGQKGFIRGEEE